MMDIGMPCTSRGKVYYETEDGEMEEVCMVRGHEIDLSEVIQDHMDIRYALSNSPIELRFEGHIDMRGLYREIGLTNNYRRMHGLPLMRKR